MISMISILKILFYKIKYQKRIACNLYQKWHGLNIAISSDGNVQIGKRLKTRGQDHILVEGGVLKVGDYCFLNYNVSVTCKDNISIGSHVQIANNVVIVDHNHDYKNGGFVCGTVSIEDGVWIGANAVVLPGVTIGKCAVVAAGCVVNKNVPEYAIVAGVPSKVIGYYSKEQV